MASGRRLERRGARGWARIDGCDPGSRSIVPPARRLSAIRGGESCLRSRQAGDDRASVGGCVTPHENGWAVARPAGKKRGRALARPLVSSTRRRPQTVGFGAVERISALVRFDLLKFSSVIVELSLSVMTVLLPTCVADEKAVAAALVP